jgi:DNA-binding MarR family transcriptional regulator
MGLVRRLRSTADRRVVLVELTDAAHPVVNAYLAEVTTLHAHQFAVLDEQERETFVRLLAKVAASVESLDVDAVVATARPRKGPRKARRQR